MKEWRTAVVGAGLMGTWHGRYARRAGAKVVAVVDREARLAQPLAQSLGGRAYAEGEEWLESSAADVVHLCTPLASHGALAAKSLDAGCHVVVEKPLTATLQETQDLLALARRRERWLIAVHQMPFQRGVRQLLSRRAGLGELVRVEHRVCTAGALGRPPAERRAILHGILSHSLSLFYVLGLGVEDVGLWRVAFDGADGLELMAAAGRTRLVVSFSAEARPTVNELVVWGTKGAAKVDLFHGFCVFEPGRVSREDKVLRPFRLALRTLVGAGFNLGVRALARHPAYPGLAELLTAFYAGLEGAHPVPVAEEEILMAAALQQRLMVETPRP